MKRSRKPLFFKWRKWHKQSSPPKDLFLAPPIDLGDLLNKPPKKRAPLFSWRSPFLQALALGVCSGISCYGLIHIIRHLAQPLFAQTLPNASELSDLNQAPLTFEADLLKGDLNSKEVTLQGDVLLQKGSLNLVTDQVMLDLNQAFARVLAPSLLTLLNSGAPLEATSASPLFSIMTSQLGLNFETEQLLMGQSELKFSYLRSLIQTDFAQSFPQNYLLLNQVLYRFCDSCDFAPSYRPFLSFKASQLLIDQETSQLYFTHVTPRVLGVPFFYMPYLRLNGPGVKRASGFLTPEIRRSIHKGHSLFAPYFLALSPSDDLTLYPSIYEGGDILLRTRYRNLWEQGFLTLYTDFAFIKPTDFAKDILPARPHLEERFSYFMQIEGHHYLFQDYIQDLRLSWRYHRISDPYYLNEFNFSSARFLQNKYTLDYHTPWQSTELSYRDYVYLRGSPPNKGLESLPLWLSHQSAFVVQSSKNTRFTFKNHLTSRYVRLLEASTYGKNEAQLEATFQWVDPLLYTEQRVFAGTYGQLYDYTPKSQVEEQHKQDHNWAYYIGTRVALPLEITFDSSPTTQLHIRPEVQVLYGESQKDSPPDLPDNDTRNTWLSRSNFFNPNRLSGTDNLRLGGRLDTALTADLYQNETLKSSFFIGHSWLRDEDSLFNSPSPQSDPSVLNETDLIGEFTWHANSTLSLDYGFSWNSDRNVMTQHYFRSKLKMRFDNWTNRPELQDVQSQLELLYLRSDPTVLDLSQDPLRNVIVPSLNLSLSNQFSLSSKLELNLENDYSLVRDYLGIDFTLSYFAFRLATQKDYLLEERDYRFSVELLFTR